MSTITRTRNGCWACRSRRVKCDQTRPICHRCAKGKRDCSYGIRLTWHEESLSRGVCHGRSGVWSKNGKHGNQNRPRQNADQDQWDTRLEAQRSHHQFDRIVFLNTTIRDLELYFEYEQPGVKDWDLEDVQPQTEEPASVAVALKENQDNDSRDATEMSMVLTVMSQQIPYINLFAFRILRQDSTLLSYYEAVICSSSTLLDDADHNPYRHLILPMAMQSEPLYHAIMAVSAQIMRISNPSFSVPALEHRQMALKGLADTLQTESLSDSDMDEILAVALVLCWYEITDASRPSWVTHLNGLRVLMVQGQQRSPSFASRNAPLYRFFNRYFAFHLVLARTAFPIDDEVPFSKQTQAKPQRSAYKSRRIDYLEGSSDLEDNSQSFSFSNSTEFLSLHMSLDHLDQIDPYMGFSDSLLLLINEVADLARQGPLIYEKSQNLDQKTLFQIKVRRLRDSLENLHQTPPPLRYIEGSDMTDGDEGNQSTYTYTVSEISAIAEAYRLGALLLLQKISPSLPIARDLIDEYNSSGIDRDHEDDSEEHLSLEAGYVRDILSLMMNHLSRIRQTAALPLWPLFLAGCCATNEEDRIIVITIFDQLEGMKRFGNISPARKVVELVWRQRDLGVQDDRKRRKAAVVSMNMDCNSTKDGSDATRPFSLSRTQRFEWEQAMFMLGGWKLSLT